MKKSKLKIYGNFLENFYNIKPLQNLHIILFWICFIILGTIQVEATPGNINFEDDFFYQAIIDTLNEQDYNGIDDRTLSYNVTEEELKSIVILNFGNIDQMNALKNLKGLEKLSSLEYLTIQYTNIDEIDISKNTNLKYLSIINANSLDNIDFSKNINLETINLIYTHLKELDVKNCTKLKYINMGSGMVSDGKIEKLDLSNCKELVKLSISGNKLKSIDLSNNTKLEEVHLTNGNIKHIILPQNSKIEKLELFENKIENLEEIENLETLQNLKTLYIQNNYIEEFSLLEYLPKIDDINVDNSTVINSINKNEVRNIKEKSDTKQENNTEKIKKEMINYFVMICIVNMIVVYYIRKKNSKI